VAQFDQPPAAGLAPPPAAPAGADPPTDSAAGPPTDSSAGSTAGSPTTGRISPRRAFAELAAVYVPSFGLGIVSAIVLLRDPNYGSSDNGNIINDLQSAALEIFSYVMQAAVVIFGVGYFGQRRGLTLSSLFGRFKRPAAYSATPYGSNSYATGPYGAAPYAAGPYSGGPYAAAPQLAPQPDPQQPVAAWGAGFQTMSPGYAQFGYPQSAYGMRQPVERGPAWQFTRVFFLAMGGFIAFLIVAVIYQDVTTQVTGAPSQGSSLWLIPVGLFVSAAAGFGEEMLITGMVVTTLEQAGFGKRAWVIYLVAIALRIPFHLYYGWAAVGVICFTVMNVYIYRRWRLLWPIVLAHMAYDFIESISQTIPGNAANLPILGLALLTFIMVIIVACIEGSDAAGRRRYRAFSAYQTAMAGSAGQAPQPPYAGPYPGPYPAQYPPGPSPLQPQVFEWAQTGAPPQPSPPAAIQVADQPPFQPAQPFDSSQFSNPQFSNPQFSNPQPLNPQPLNPQPLNPQSVNPQAPQPPQFPSF
jgi:membrane protease YdiL (CAAX protease family)